MEKKDGRLQRRSNSSNTSSALSARGRLSSGMPTILPYFAPYVITSDRLVGLATVVYDSAPRIKLLSINIACTRLASQSIDVDTVDPVRVSTAVGAESKTQE